jgi:hypothetical protein
MNQEAKNKMNETLASNLAGLGYPGFSHLKHDRKNTPAEVVLYALKASDLEPRVTEALPWVLYAYPDLDWEWLVRESLLNEVQNRLGFLTNLARRLAEESGAVVVATLLGMKEAVLDQSRLEREDTLCHESMTQVERRWLSSSRSKEAQHWRLLTDLKLEHLSYSSASRQWKARTIRR